MARAFSRSADIGCFLFGQADVVETVEQAMLAERVYLDTHDFAVGARDRLLFEVDRQHRVGALLGVFHQLVDDVLRQGDRQQAVLEAVGVEDVGKTRRDDAGHAEIHQRPGCVLAARPAAEIVAGDADPLRGGRAGPAQSGSLSGCFTSVDLLKRATGEAGALDRLR